MKKILLITSSLTGCARKPVPDALAQQFRKFPGWKYGKTGAEKAGGAA